MENFKRINKAKNINKKVNKHSIYTQMKNSILIALVAAVVMACGGGAGEKSELDTLIAEKDSLKKIKDELSGAIAELETQIKDLDTTKTFTLVTTEAVRRENFKHYFQVYGTVKSDQNAQIYSEVSGKIITIKVKEGNRVAKGQVLAVIDVSVMREQEQELKTRLELAETTYRKQKKLWDQNIGSEMQYLQAKSNRDALRSSLSSLQTQMAMGNVKAPFSGVIDEIFPRVGEMAMPGFPLFRLVNLDEVYIKADVSESYLGKVKEGDKVVVSLPSVGTKLESDIERTGQYINEANRTFKIKTTIQNKDKMLKPNMVALLEIEDFSRDSAIVISSDLILQGAGGTQYVYVVNGTNGIAVAEKTLVEVEMTYKDKALIASGLTGNENLVKKGARSIRNGQQIEVKN